MENKQYELFVEKFKRKKTTDDCYTPQHIYEIVLSWVKENFPTAKDAPIVRPFWPDTDYKDYDYPEGAVVVDNPPFSIMAEILRYYEAKKIHYFLFANHLTLFVSLRRGMCAIVCNEDVVYENGATIATSFITNLPELKDVAFMTAPALKTAIKSVRKDKRKRKAERAFNNVSSATMGKYSDWDYKALWDDITPPPKKTIWREFLCQWREPE